MIAGVADTHTALWHLFDDARLSAAAKAFIDEAATSRRKIAISSISLAEVVYLVEKNRLPGTADFVTEVERRLGGPIARRAPGRKAVAIPVGEQLNLLQ